VKRDAGAEDSSAPFSAFLLGVFWVTRADDVFRPFFSSVSQKRASMLWFPISEKLASVGWVYVF